MFAIGHFALGYLTGKGSSKLAKVKINLPLLFVASVIPDVDLALKIPFPGFQHRGPTHSLITFMVLMIPLFIIYRKKAIPYFAALLSHSLIGDFFTGGVMLFWPLSHEFFGFGGYDVNSLPSVIAEIILFLISLAIMLKTKDLQSLLKSSQHNWLLIVPFFAVLGPLVQTGRQGVSENFLPLPLVIPSLFWLAIFAYAILFELRNKHKMPRDKNG
jgi:membrane-bound metal-dependent hydrolase YbcI (DUF457 family)